MDAKERRVIEEIKGLSKEARAYLAEGCRNGLQALLGTLEIPNVEAAKDEVYEIKNFLRI